MVFIPEKWILWMLWQEPLNPPNVLRVWKDSCWQESSQCYCSLEKGHEEGPRNLQTVSLTSVPGEIMETFIRGDTRRHLKKKMHSSDTANIGSQRESLL